MEINLNSNVIVRLLPRGEIAFKEHYNKLGLDPEDYRKISRQPDDRYKFPLWELMLIFGESMAMTEPPPIEMVIELIDKEGE